MLRIPWETRQSKAYSVVHGPYLLVWLPSLRSGPSGSLTPDTPGLIPCTSGSTPPTSLDRALKTTSDFRAHCPTPREVGCVWACSSLGTAKSGQSLLSPNPAQRLGQVSGFRLWLRGDARNLQRGIPVGSADRGRGEGSHMYLLPGGV